MRNALFAVIIAVCIAIWTYWGLVAHGEKARNQRLIENAQICKDRGGKVLTDEMLRFKGCEL